MSFPDTVDELYTILKAHPVTATSNIPNVFSYHLFVERFYKEFLIWKIVKLKVHKEFALNGRFLVVSNEGIVSRFRYDSTKDKFIKEKPPGL